MGKLTGFIDYKQKLTKYISPQERIKHFNEFLIPLDEEEQKIQASRCMDCGIPFCHSSYGCPVDNLIPEWNHLLYLGRWEDAFKRLRKTNNFPEFTGRVCPAPCETACVLGINNDPVSIKDNECAIIDKAYDKGYMVPRPPKQRNEKKICIVGSGPSGLAAADELNKMGYTVTVFEKNDRIGGLLMYGIPNMKLDKKLVEKRCAIMQEEGVVFKTNVYIGKDIQAKDIIKNYDAILLTCGATVPRDLQVKGRKANGIYFAVDFLKMNTKSLLDSNLTDNKFINTQGKHVIVIGGGDTGNDCIGTAIRHNAASITNFELLPKPHPQRSSEHPWPLYPRVFKSDYGHSEASDRHGRDPREFSILTKEFILNKDNDLSAIKTCRVKWEKPPSAPPRFVEIKNSEETWKADIALLAMGFLGPEQELLKKLNIERNTKTTTIKATFEEFKTSHEKIFTAGDARRGQSLVVWAIQEGRGAAKKINEYLTISKK